VKFDQDELMSPAQRDAARREGTPLLREIDDEDEQLRWQREQFLSAGDEEAPEPITYAQFVRVLNPKQREALRA
jgi:hypothetical protein